MVEYKFSTPPIDPMIPSYDEIQQRFYGITDQLAQKAHEENANIAFGQTIAVGSSIIRLWDNIQRDLAPYPVINHGFGGSRTWEMIHFGDKLVTQFSPKVVIIYCGSNDINAGEPAEPIATRNINFMKYLHSALPGVHLIFIAINRAPQKEDKWHVADEANAKIKEEVDKIDTWHWVDVNPGMFNESGRPRDDMFERDGLHLYEKAYSEVWKPLVLEKLQGIWEKINSAR